MTIYDVLLCSKFTRKLPVRTTITCFVVVIICYESQLMVCLSIAGCCQAVPFYPSILRTSMSTKELARNLPLRSFVESIMEGPERCGMPND